MASQLLELHRLPYGQFRCRDCHTVNTQFQIYEQGRYESTRCYDCYYEHKDRTVNPIQMGNRHNHQFNGSDMRYYRFTVRDNGNLLTVREAQKLGMVCKREGRLSRYYVAGVLMCAYSYNTCIYARKFDAVEGDTRDVFNFTPYSKTTNEHVDTVIREVLGIAHWQWVAGYTESYEYDENTWQRTTTDRTPLSKRARRAVELVRVATDTTAEQLADMVNVAVSL